MALMLFGEFEHQIDDKSRLSIPARFREQCLKEKGSKLAIVGGFDPCLWLLPPEQAAEMTALFSMQRTEWNETARLLRLRVLSTWNEVKPDTQGRVYLTDRQKGHAGLDRRVIVVGNIDRIEVWDPKRYEEQLAKPEKAGLSLSDLAFKALSGLPPEQKER